MLSNVRSSKSTGMSRAMSWLTWSAIWLFEASLSRHWTHIFRLANLSVHSRSHMKQWRGNHHHDNASWLSASPGSKSAFACLCVSLLYSSHPVTAKRITTIPPRTANTFKAQSHARRLIRLHRLGSKPGVLVHWQPSRNPIQAASKTQSMAHLIVQQDTAQRTWQPLEGRATPHQICCSTWPHLF